VRGFSIWMGVKGKQEERKKKIKGNRQKSKTEKTKGEMEADGGRGMFCIPATSVKKQDRASGEILEKEK